MERSAAPTGGAPAHRCGGPPDRHGRKQADLRRQDDREQAAVIANRIRTATRPWWAPARGRVAAALGQARSAAPIVGPLAPPPS